MTFYIETTARAVARLDSKLWFKIDINKRAKAKKNYILRAQPTAEEEAEEIKRVATQV